MLEGFYIPLLKDKINEVVEKLQLKYYESTDGFSFVLDALGYLLQIMLDCTGKTIQYVINVISELPIIRDVKRYIIDKLNINIDNVNNYSEEKIDVVENTVVKLTTVLSVYNCIQISVMNLAMSSEYKVIYLPLVITSSTFLYLLGLKYGSKFLKDLKDKIIDECKSMIQENPEYIQQS